MTGKERRGVEKRKRDDARTYTVTLSGRFIREAWDALDRFDEHEEIDTDNAIEIAEKLRAVALKARTEGR